jgi:hypothetical protein
MVQRWGGNCINNNNNFFDGNNINIGRITANGRLDGINKIEENTIG